MKYIRTFTSLRLKDVPLVGGKNASLGQMIADLAQAGVTIPHGFAVTAEAYWDYLNHNNFVDEMKKVMAKLKDPSDLDMLQAVGNEIRSLLVSGTIPDDLKKEIEAAYKELSSSYHVQDCDVAVRSSATAEDLPTASFAGQQETYLNIQGTKDLLQAYKKCVASLFTNRAIVYRNEHGFDHFKVALSVGVQKMVRSDKASSGVAFSLDTETGFKDVIIINSSWGLGESIVKGLVIPDEFVVFKTTLLQGFKPIIKKRLGDKKIKIIYNGKESPTKKVAVPKEEQDTFSLSDEEIIFLSRMINAIDEHYTELKGEWSPMDVEWAKDGIDGKLYILQARPETVHAIKDSSTYKTYQLKNGERERYKDKLLATGQSIGQQIVTGTARVIPDVSYIEQVQDGDILITTMTDPDWVPVMKKAAGIITNLGGRTCHAAIVSRELGTPAIVGAEDATKKIKSGQKITLDCSRGTIGFVYDGELEYEVKKIELKVIPTPPVQLMVNIADPAGAFRVSILPTSGVGLARIEFIFSNAIKVHPMALLHPEKVTDQKVKNKIEKLTKAYPDKKKFFVEKLAQGIGTIAAAFYPRPVIVRLSDFKTNEYYNLVGGSYFEPKEANPMLGFRGASRYYHEKYKEAFALECEAFKVVRDQMGLDNVKIMIPFVRTIKEAQEVISIMGNYNLKRGKDNLEFVMMVEVPSNVMLIEEFSEFFDGFSIGSNDLTQLTLGIDRDSALLHKAFDERDQAVKKMLVMAIEGAHKKGRFIGICGQAPSDYPELAEFLIKENIDSISLNPDSVLPFLMRYKK